jgi:oxygen-dependent protoporphyrinogen oxidase
MAPSKHIVIIGGGITGLSAAWELQQRGHTNYTILEQEARWGGKVITTRIPGQDGSSFIIDGGPESFITRKPEVWELAHELGIQDQIADPGSETSHMFVLTQGKPLPVPLNPLLFITSPIMSTRGKLRMMAEPFIPPRRDGQDESLASYVTRRLGREALDQFIGPVLAGIYNTDPERQSILTTSPIMREMESEYGSLVKAVIGRARKAHKKSNSTAKPRFITFRNGAEGLVTTLTTQLAGQLRLNAAVHRLSRKNGGTGYQVGLANGEILTADALILATPANITAQFMQDLSAEIAQELAAIRHENIGTATLIFRSDDVKTKVRIHGLMAPRRERRSIDAITFTSLKMPVRAPAGYNMIRVFFGGSYPPMVLQDDDQLQQIILEELKQLLGIQAQPVQMVAYRWPHSFPQADVGHLDRLDALLTKLPQGIYLAGSSYRGIGVPDCIRQGRDAAALALQPK